MTLVKYVGNLIPGSGTAAIQLAKDRVLKLGGPAVEISDAEFAKLRVKYDLTLVEPEKSEAPQAPTTAPQAPDKPSQTFPATPGAPVIPTENPSTPDLGS